MDWNKVFNYADAAAFRVCARFGCLHLVEDARQHALLEVLLRPDRGHGPRRLNQEVIQFLRSWWGEDHDHTLGIYRVGEMPDEIEHDDQVEVRALCLRRLQQVWLTLTQRQREAVMAWASRGRITRSARGVHESRDERRARRAESASAMTAIARMTDPSRYRYEARRNENKA